MASTNWIWFGRSGTKPYLPDSMYVPANILYERIRIGTIGSRIHVPHNPSSRRTMGSLSRRIRRQTQPQTR